MLPNSSVHYMCTSHTTHSHSHTYILLTQEDVQDVFGDKAVAETVILLLLVLLFNVNVLACAHTSHRNAF